jgi:uncharacterized protein YutE (UPF0331/DUF86 family)/predicted nucleotidyltransferase
MSDVITQPLSKSSPDILLSCLRHALSDAPAVAFAYLFGSAVQREEFRDLDIAVYLNTHDLSAYERFKAAEQIGRLIEKSLSPRRAVDIRLLNEAPLLFQYEVLSTGHLIFERHHRQRISYETRVCSAYLDYQPVWRALLHSYLTGDYPMNQPTDIIQHLQEMDEALADWKRYQETITLDHVQQNRDARNMVLQAMFVSIQAAIDIANHLIVQTNARRPTTYREAFEILAETAIIPLDLSDELSDLAGFRNVLVHIYWKLDLQRAYEILQHGSPSLRRFSEIVRQYLISSQKEQPPAPET